MERYKNRQEAGKILAKKLKTLISKEEHCIVLALPRGGLPVAYEIAEAIKAPLDVVIVRKLGVPQHSELAMGAIAMGGVILLNEDIIKELGIDQKAIQEVINKEKKELARRESVYRGGKIFPNLRAKTVIIVDDGIATGATMQVAIKSLKQFSPVRLIAAVPVVQKSLYETMKALVDDFVCPLTPLQLYAVGAWYEDFSQTEDEAVHALLAKTQKHPFN